MADFYWLLFDFPQLEYASESAIAETPLGAKYNGPILNTVFRNQLLVSSLIRYDNNRRRVIAGNLGALRLSILEKA